MRVVAVVIIAACSSPEPSLVADPDAAIVRDPDGSITQSGSCDGKEAQPLDATWMIGNRVARVHVPASYDPSKPTPVVFDVHGRTQSASAQMALSRSKAKSDAAGFIAIYPESATSPTSWNSGTCCDPAAANQVDDTAFLRALLDEAVAKLCVDPARVYMMGMSNGAYESHRIGCELADRFAAIGPVAGLLLFQGCAPSRPLPVMMVNGTADTLSQYQYVQSGVDFWVAKNKCTTKTTTYQNGDATCVTHGGCTAGADVVLCTIQDGGHQWPGGDTLPFLGKKSDDLIATDRIWDFFVAHPKP